MPRDTVTLPHSRFEASMDFPGAESQAGPVRNGPLPALPKIWIGYVLGVITLISELVAISLHPEVANGALIVPPLYLFLPAFIGSVYWFACIYQYHVVMKNIP